MASKFWVCVAVIAVALAQTYVYSLNADNINSKRDFSGLADKLMANVGETLETIKDELKLALVQGQKLTQSAREVIAKYRTRRADLKANKKTMSLF